MMTVNAFWFGFLIAVVLVLVLLISVAFISARRSEQEEEISDQEYKEILEGMTGKKFKVVRKNGYLVGEPIEDPDDDEDQ